MTADHFGVHGPEREVALDMAKLGRFLGPALMVGSFAFWGLSGLASSALAFAIVVFNLLLGAWLIGRAVAISPELLMGAMLGGFLVRLGLLSVIVLPIRNMDWFEVAPFGIALVGGHLGLLAWETQRVSASFAYPGMPPSNRTPLTAARARSESE